MTNDISKFIRHIATHKAGTEAKDDLMQVAVMVDRMGDQLTAAFALIEASNQSKKAAKEGCESLKDIVSVQADIIGLLQEESAGLKIEIAEMRGEKFTDLDDIIQKRG